MRRFLDLVRENKKLRIEVEEGIKQANAAMSVARCVMSDKRSTCAHAAHSGDEP